MAWWRGGVVAWWRNAVAFGGVMAHLAQVVWWRRWRGGVVAWWRVGVVAWWCGAVVPWCRGAVVACCECQERASVGHAAGSAPPRQAQRQQLGRFRRRWHRSRARYHKGPRAEPRRPKYVSPPLLLADSYFLPLIFAFCSPALPHSRLPLASSCAWTVLLRSFPHPLHVSGASVGFVGSISPPCLCAARGPCNVNKRLTISVVFFC